MNSLQVATQLKVVSTPLQVGQPLIVFLHGFATLPSDFEALRVIGAKCGAGVVLPCSPLSVPAGVLGREQATAAWWPVNVEQRAAALINGPRDLSSANPRGVTMARARLSRLLQQLRAELKPSQLIVGGFSQGAMLAVDWQLHSRERADALVLMSGARIRAHVWEDRLSRLAGSPVFQSHGRHDSDLSFAAAERLRDVMLGAGAKVTWLACDTGHEASLPAWRGVMRFLRVHLKQNHEQALERSFDSVTPLSQRAQSSRPPGQALHTGESTTEA